MKNDTQKMTVEVPKDLKAALNERARESFTTVSTIVRQVLHESLQVNPDPIKKAKS